MLRHHTVAAVFGTFGLCIASTAALAQIPLCTAPGSQDQVALAAGDSFVVVVWRDDRNSLSSSFDIYGQVLELFGNRPWRQGSSTAGLPICNAPDQQDQPIVTVGIDGVISVAWRDARVCGSGAERIFAQDLNSGGTPLFGVNGDSVDVDCPAGGQDRGSRHPRILSAPSGANFLTWNYRANGSGDLRTRKRADGTAATLCAGTPWPVPWFGCIPDAAAAIISDGSNGMIAVFQDLCCNGNIHARRVDAACNVSWTEPSAYCVGDPNFPIPVRVSKQGGGGDPPMTAKGNYAVATDGAGGAIVVWEDGPSGSRIIRAQRFNGSGLRQWGDLGKVIAESGGDLRGPQIVRSTSGRSFVIWEAVTSVSESDVFAQRINILGDTLGTRIPVCTAPLTQTEVRAAAAPGGGCFIVWEDLRDLGAGDFGDVFVQKLEATGNLGCQVDGQRFPAPSETRQYEPRIVAVPLRFQRADTALVTQAVVVWRDDRNGNPDLYAWILEAACPLIVLDSPSTPGGTSGEFSTRSAPNPFGGHVRIFFTIPEAAAVDVAVYDIAGKRICSLMNGTRLPSGDHSFLWNGRADSGALVRPGVYVYSVRVGEQHDTRRIVLVR